jgi:hypothetical protein
MARCDDLADDYPLGQQAPGHGEGRNQIQSIAQKPLPSSSKSAAERFFAITELRQEMYRQLDSISLVRFLSVRKGPHYMYFAEVARVLYEELDWDDRDDIGVDSVRICPSPRFVDDQTAFTDLQASPQLVFRGCAIRRRIVYHIEK